MPTYQYACTACDHRFEQVQSFTDDALTECPECAGRLRKLYGSVGVVFKGSGFYRTDSRAGNGSSSSEKSSSDKSSPEKSTSSSEKKESGAKKETSSSGSDKSPAASSSSGTTGPVAKAS